MKKLEKNKFYKTNSKGISLIVLIITIIVIIILATAILLSVISNNPISEANKARYESDRDNMQAVFTNTVGKIMAENQGTVNVTAGQINTVTQDVNETTGTVSYTVDNATVAANASGTIVFDKDTNTATTYYTGKKLPIYAAGETKWYVDSDGVLSLEVAGVKYGSGEILSSIDETKTLEAGIYDNSGNLVSSWDELVNTYGLNIESDNLSPGYGGNTQMSYLLINTAEFSNITKVVIPEGVQKIGSGSFWDENSKLTSIIIPDSVITIGDYAFADCNNLIGLAIPDSVTSIGFSAFNNVSCDIYYSGSATEENGDWCHAGEIKPYSETPADLLP